MTDNEMMVQLERILDPNTRPKQKVRLIESLNKTFSDFMGGNGNGAFLTFGQKDTQSLIIHIIGHLEEEFQDTIGCLSTLSPLPKINRDITQFFENVRLVMRDFDSMIKERRPKISGLSLLRLILSLGRSHTKGFNSTLGNTVEL